MPHSFTKLLSSMVGYTCFSTGIHFKIEIRWKIPFALIYIITKLCLQNFGLVMTARADISGGMIAENLIIHA